ncbi:Uncharacterised protein [Mycobacterium tuberculosis]|nr:Uncharacterised protein [Mycobacterium tuberculosis]
MAVPRVTAPTSRPSTRASEAAPMGDEIGPWAASLTARLARSPASAAPTATITPATACVDRS